jgi:cytochrome c oxidase assembly protein subunit 15
MSRLARFAWVTLACNVAVILWGAFVRATGSGAGCGSHWPLCNGQVVPRSPSAETLVELSHRLTSGVALLAVAGLCWWVHREVRRGHPARLAAGISLALILVEAAVGAGLVLWGLVADAATGGRAIVVAIHLTNTFLLLGALTLTAHWVSGGAAWGPVARPGPAWTIGLLALGLILVGASGAVTALGDTLFPPASFSEAVAADLPGGSPFFVRLRVVHPAFAVLVSVALARSAGRLAAQHHDRRGFVASRAVTWLAALQIAAGVVNVWLLAPVWLQLVHLLIADLLWIAFVILAASALALQPASVREEIDRRALASRSS